MSAVQLWLLCAMARRRERQQRRRTYPLQRVYRPRTQFLDLTEDQCIRRYRFDKETILYLCNQLESDLLPTAWRGQALPVHLKVTTALAFLASGNFQTPLGATSGISQSATSRCIAQFLEAFLRKDTEYIAFPEQEQQLHETMTEFYELAHFPSVLGVIDCTHIPIRPPSGKEATYRNRKSFHSLNMQVVCNASSIITDVCACFPGSCSSTYILSQSGLHDRFESGQITGGWLLGDKDYPLKTWLMTPIVSPEGEAEKSYNKAHRQTRAVVEKTFGLLKTRFKCLDRSGGQLLYTPGKARDIFLACCMLHNLALTRKMPDPEGPQLQHTDADEEGEIAQQQETPHPQPDEQAVAVRHELIHGHF
uniref:Putative nuclease HARBI1 n=1 Tax=Geotrypetes seraphini TaxID=260995 RepID=A0A6P8R064_GEOSA|nr:putative nuclease HARBI1 [Geotrypetes seraphini]